MTIFLMSGINAALREKINEITVLFEAGGLLDFIRLMCKNSHNLSADRLRFKAGEKVRTPQGSDCGAACANVAGGLNSAGEKAGRRVSGFVLLALVFMQLRVLAVSTSVTLSWNPSTDPTIAGYNIYYGGASYTYTNEISIGNSTSVTISGLIPGTTYYFAATTYSALGFESAFSSELAYLVPSIVNQPPTLNAINNLTINQNTGSQTVSISDITSGATTENQTLTVTAISSDTNLISNPTINYTSPNTAGTLVFTPVYNANGTAVITVTVSDGQTQNNIVMRTFTVTVIADRSADLLINPLTNVATMEGQTITFNAVATGKSRLSYQWKFNGTNLPAAAGSSLTLSNITTNQAGIYSVAASDGHYTTSQEATLTVYAAAVAKLAPAAHASGQYALAVAGVPGYQYVVQASTDLVNWVPVQTNTAPFTFVDTNAGKFSQRFYRSVYAP
jgi:hypothetical protein